MTDTVICHYRDDNVLEITLNSADTGNRLTPIMIETFRHAVENLREGTRFVILTAEGPDFCVGRTSPMPAADARPTAFDLRRMVSDPTLAFYDAVRACPAPVISVIKGRAIGIGCGLAALGDLVIAAESATFSVPELDLDITPTLVMSALLDRIPRASLAHLVYSRDTISASQAQNIGIVSMVVADNELDAEVDRILTKLSKNSATALQSIKTFLSLNPGTDAAARTEMAALLNCVATAERYRA